MSKKRGRSLKINITLSNRWLYTLILIGILIAIGVGVYAYGTSNPAVFGHSSGELAPPSPCATDQFLKWNGASWVCGIPSQTPPNYLHNYSTQDTIFGLLSPSIPNAGNKIPINGGAPIGTYIWTFSYAERMNANTINLGGTRYSSAESSLGISSVAITDGSTNGFWISITW